MCTGAEVAYLVISAIGAGTAIKSAENQEDYNHYLAKQAQFDADTEKQAGEIRAQERRDQARRVAASARANLAASGVNVDSETANAINADIIKRGELDAFTEQNSSLDAAGRLRAEASALKIRGQQAKVSGYGQAATTIALYGEKSGWYGAGGSGQSSSQSTSAGGP